MEKNYEVKDEIEIDLKALFFELLGNWMTIVVSTVLVAAIMFCYSKFMLTPQYQSTSELYVLSSSTSITNLADIQVGTYMTKDYVVVITGRPVLEQVIKNLDLNMSYKSLRGKIRVNNPDDTRIIQITITDADPNRAKLITDELAEVSSAYIAEKMDQDAPSIISYGYADGGAVSPNVSRNTILGGIIGAVIAIAIVGISYLLNDTIMTPEETERKLGLNVLGTLPLEEEEYDGKKRKSGKQTKRIMQVVGKQKRNK
jgi:capsular polysaccharide biosynthesis protein